MDTSIRRALTPDDFIAVKTLSDRMGKWDAEMVDLMGFDGSTTIPLFYSRTPQQLSERFTAPGTAMFLSVLQGKPVGCFGYSKHAPGMAEVQKLFVAEEARGHRLGEQLMAAVLDGMRSDGYGAARLETVEFMTSAIALYERSGFRRCPSFRAPPPELVTLTLWMEREL